MKSTLFKELLPAILLELIIEEVESLSKGDEGEEIPIFLSDNSPQYFERSPLIYRIDKILNNLYKETPYEKYTD